MTWKGAERTKDGRRAKVRVRNFMLIECEVDVGQERRRWAGIKKKERETKKMERGRSFLLQRQLSLKENEKPINLALIKSQLFSPQGKKPYQRETQVRGRYSTDFLWPLDLSPQCRHHYIIDGNVSLPTYLLAS